MSIQGFFDNFGWKFWAVFCVISALSLKLFYDFPFFPSLIFVVIMWASLGLLCKSKFFNDKEKGKGWLGLLVWIFVIIIAFGILF